MLNVKFTYRTQQSSNVQPMKYSNVAGSCINHTFELHKRTWFQRYAHLQDRCSSHEHRQSARRQREWCPRHVFRSPHERTPPEVLPAAASQPCLCAESVRTMPLARTYELFCTVFSDPVFEVAIAENEEWLYEVKLRWLVYKSYLK